MPKKRLSRDQKRKQKLRKKRRTGRAGPRKKYRTEKYIMTIMRAEVGIYETFRMTERQLTDGEVRLALRQLIAELRSGPYTPAEVREVVEIREGEYEDLVIWNIKRNWDDLFATQPRHPNADLIGCLRTILDSIETWATPGPASRGYLSYLEGFMGRMGVTVERLPLSEWEEEEEEETAEAYLQELGEDWLRFRDREAWQAFEGEARAMLGQRQAQEVINVCQHLIGQVNEPWVIEELRPLLRAAYGQLGVPFGRPPG
ncbi:MAG TPA: hypothetical protein EYP55_08160 [Anaerolineae bacterium]|nr:hypothetical protein [Anaerolineae bacterium]